MLSLAMRYLRKLRSSLGYTKQKGSVHTVTVDLRDHVDENMKKRRENRSV